MIGDKLKDQELTKKANDCFEHVGKYLVAELSGNADLELLEQMNLTAKERVEKLSLESTELVTTASKIQRNYKQIETFASKIDDISRHIDALKELADELNAYSKDLETKFNKYM
ncbi:hypothetical protein BB560_001790 [Smittium megazygosporum]|uniref:Biogenesis of lysosome-related organelles complex 1 subunit 2 n=1 Tax=Smittium megazygosporum TaxID=133381 RepID=A0A2T9ZGN1_9FUNG|nr:hypothetical protein BB560_006530 [Smittium megazygosporum]PVV03720.1 hypothetical protein BB560_001790 [Smittium megazygosporum]